MIMEIPLKLPESIQHNFAGVQSLPVNLLVKEILKIYLLSVGISY